MDELTDVVPTEAAAEVVTTEATTQEAPAAEAPAEVAAPELYELPDGRKMDGQALYKEYAENLLPEFTRRSQELSTLKTQTAPQTAPSTQPALAPWEDPAYAPQTVPEFLAILDQREQAKVQAQQKAHENVKASVDAELASLKEKDPNLNEDRLFQHALKYRGMPLSVAYQNMVDMGLVAKTAAERAQKNLTDRAGIPISGTTGGGSSNSVGVDYNSIHAESPKEMLRRVSST